MWKNFIFKYIAVNQKRELFLSLYLSGSFHVKTDYKIQLDIRLTLWIKPISKIIQPL